MYIYICTYTYMYVEKIKYIAKVASNNQRNIIYIYIYVYICLYDKRKELGFLSVNKNLKFL